MKVLLTGGLGYIGSHIASLLGSSSIIVDNQSNSSLNYKKYLPESIVYIENINLKSLNKIFARHKVTGVIHLAGLKSVTCSTADPLKYFKANFNTSIDLLEAMDKNKIRKLIFSSSATVYGSKHKSPLKENLGLTAESPYGSTKILIEQMIDDYAKSNAKFRGISLRYFNPIGANNNAGLSDKPKGMPENLVPLLVEAAKYKKKFYIYGKNYKTKDGTCIRDFIHIKDLALAHLLALKKINKINGHEKINLGLGKGASVLEIIKLFEKTNDLKVNYSFARPRKGDVATCFADNKKALKLLGWKPHYNYKDMVKDAWDAQK